MAVKLCPEWTVRNVGEQWNTLTFDGGKTFTRADVSSSTVEFTSCCRRDTVTSDYTVDVDAWTLTHPQYGTVRDFCVSPFGSPPPAVLCVDDTNATVLARYSLAVFCIVVTVTLMVFLNRVGNKLAQATMCLNVFLFLKLMEIAAVYFTYYDRNAICGWNSPQDPLRTADVLLYCLVIQFIWIVRIILDIWSKFRKISSTTSEGHHHRYRWLMYCFTSCALPLATAFLVQFVHTRNSYVIFVVAPITAMLLINVWMLYDCWHKSTSENEKIKHGNLQLWFCVRLLFASVTSCLLYILCLYIAPPYYVLFSYLDTASGLPIYIGRSLLFLYAFPGVLAFILSIWSRECPSTRMVTSDAERLITVNM